MTASRRDYNSRGPGFRRAVGFFGAAAVCGIAATVVIATSDAGAQTQGQQGQGGTVNVVPVGGNSIPIPFDTSQPDIADQTYRPGGQPVRVNPGASLKEVLGDAKVDPVSFTYAEVTGADGSVLLSKAQVLATGSKPPAVFYDSDIFSFVREPSGGSDAGNLIRGVSGSFITIRLKTGKLLTVNISASPTRTKPGKPVKFTASVPQSGAGEALTYSWYFDDGNSGNGPTVTHKFKAPGSYDVTVGVTTASDKVGASETVRIQVGATTDGPNRTGGGTDSNSPLDSGPSVGGSGLGPVTGAPPIPSTGTQGQQQKTQPAPSEPVPAGDEVTGRLLTSADGQPIDPAELPPAADDQRAGARSGNPSDGDGSGVPKIAYGLLATMGMLGTGGLIELRGARSLRSW